MSPKRKGHFRGENKRVRVVKECTRSTGYPTGTFFCIYLLLYYLFLAWKAHQLWLKILRYFEFDWRNTEYTYVVLVFIWRESTRDQCWIDPKVPVCCQWFAINWQQLHPSNAQQELFSKNRIRGTTYMTQRHRYYTHTYYIQVVYIYTVYILVILLLVIINKSLIYAKNLYCYNYTGTMLVPGYCIRDMSY